jgi:hypothetical protein
MTNVRTAFERDCHGRLVAWFALSGLGRAVDLGIAQAAKGPWGPDAAWRDLPGDIVSAVADSLHRPPPDPKLARAEALVTDPNGNPIDDAERPTRTPPPGRLLDDLNAVAVVHAAGPEPGAQACFDTALPRLGTAPIPPPTSPKLASGSTDTASSRYRARLSRLKDCTNSATTFEFGGHRSAWSNEPLSGWAKCSSGCCDPINCRLRRTPIIASGSSACFPWIRHNATVLRPKSLPQPALDKFLPPPGQVSRCVHQTSTQSHVRGMNRVFALMVTAGQRPQCSRLILPYARQLGFNYRPDVTTCLHCRPAAFLSSRDVPRGKERNATANQCRCNYGRQVECHPRNLSDPPPA